MMYADSTMFDSEQSLYQYQTNHTVFISFY